MRPNLPERRPSPALVISLIALFVALGGTVYAAGKLSGTQIKKGSEPGNRLKDDSVTGQQVNESSLGTVPSALKSDTAGDAGKLGGTAAAGFVRKGDTAGGDLTGTYPDPTISPGAIPAAKSQELAGSIGTVNNDAGYFLAPVGLSEPNGQAANVSEGVSNSAITISDFSASVSVAPGSGGPIHGWQFLWIVNGNQTVACGFFQPDTSCSSSTDVQVPAGATLALESTVVNTATPARVTFGWTAHS